ncbi:MAG TPA: type II CRISPR RNA-guided endonuclease Cas9 [Nitrospinaceae bacterium]|nr:type II CRISPR RNA-guided endonuclease Cas9 [Nitrospinaceae bacterium]
MSKKILGLDLGSNSVGWALLEEVDGEASSIIDIGSRIFNKAVEEKTPTPKNVKRRDMRLGRRVIQRRARRKQRMLNYLVSLDLLPKELQGNYNPEGILNGLGDPYELRDKALKEQLDRHELGRILLHFVARRGFLSTKKQAAGDLIDDPDTIAFLDEADKKPSSDKEETAFKTDISELRKSIAESGSKTLGQYLFKVDKGQCKRNRSHDGGHLRTDRAMYREEIEAIWEIQQPYFRSLPDDFMEEDKGVKQIIFYQRPLKLRKDRVGKCSLEPKNNRTAVARLEFQRFRYLQDVNNLKYFERHSEKWMDLGNDDKKTLIEYFENNQKITVKALKDLLGLDRPTKINLETKNLKGNDTACKIRQVIAEKWDNYSDLQKNALVEDLLSIKKKSALKRRLMGYWKFESNIAVQLCLLEFEPSYANFSLKAIKKILPYLEDGATLTKVDRESGELGAIQLAGYELPDEDKTIHVVKDKLSAPPATSNPIVNKGLHEVRRVVNAIIKQYGKPDIVRVEMARDLEMNTKRYIENEKRNNKNKKANEAAVDAYKSLGLGDYPNRNDKIKYRLWNEQNQRCAYSNKTISLNTVFTAEVEIDHILPYKKSLDDSYMNKVICYTKENRNKGDRTPTDAWKGNDDKWNQITQSISSWKGLDSKVSRFYQTESEMQKRDFISSQLNDTRYISKLSLEYLKELGCDVSVTKGYVVSQIRHQWGFNDLLGEVNKKERTDHRHHAIDAVVIAATSRSLYKKAVGQIERDKLKIPTPYAGIRDELAEHLERIVVSHASHRKLSGGLHEETGAGYIERHGGLVYRKTLSPDFTIKNVKSIVDEVVREQVIKHLANYGNDPKKAFADGVKVLHKKGKKHIEKPIKRVRVLQSKTTLKSLEKYKLGLKDKSGNVFKYMSYGNTHHVEIIQHKTTGKYKGEFVTMMQASHRAKGIKSELNPEGRKQSLIKTTHGDEWLFIMALHANDLVSIALKEGSRGFYRVQALDNDGGRLVLRLHTASTIANDSEKIRKAIQVLMTSMDMTKHAINAIGIITDDKTNH